MANDNAPNGSNGNGKRRLWVIGILALVAVGGVVAFRYYLVSRHFETTDDAFLQATVSTISPQVSGRVVKLYVNSNQPVKRGDLLLEIDTRPLEAQLAEINATADLARAKKDTAQLNVGLTQDMTGAGVDDSQAQVDAAHAAIMETEAAVKAAEAEAARATTDAARFENLLTDSAVSRQQRDSAVATSQVAEARVAESKKRLAAAQSQLDAVEARLVQAKTAPKQVAMTESQVKQYSAEVAQAEASAKRVQLDLTFTKVVAPHDGIVTEKSVNEGEFVQPGQALMAIVENDTYVIANFKETQLTDMRQGQPVDMRVDAFPDRVLKGHVHSIQAGTGAVFSLLPAQNATGNYVKVVQRVPVKIVFDEALPQGVSFVPGMSVVPKVLVR